MLQEESRREERGGRGRRKKGKGKREERGEDCELEGAAKRGAKRRLCSDQWVCLGAPAPSPDSRMNQGRRDGSRNRSDLKRALPSYVQFPSRSSKEHEGVKREW